MIRPENPTPTPGHRTRSWKKPGDGAARAGERKSRGLRRLLALLGISNEDQDPRTTHRAA